MIRSRMLSFGTAPAGNTSKYVNIVNGEAGSTLIVKQVHLYNQTGVASDLVLFLATTAGARLARLELFKAVPAGDTITLSGRYFVLGPTLALQLHAVAWASPQPYPSFATFGVRLDGVAT